MATQAKLFEVQFMKEEGIVRFIFRTFTRDAVDDWTQYVRERDGKLRSPMRVIYDFSETNGLPTPYLNIVTTRVMNEIQIPDDTRTAYLVANIMQLTYYRLLARRMPKRVGMVSVFMKEHEAVKWLTNP